ncbi:MAG: hypothetical protein MJ223_00830 [Mycoplasmoidaceae bacterium]|nr:hypothetical protein [Mycoplasmoidaceae bacterium]
MINSEIAIQRIKKTGAITDAVKFVISADCTVALNKLEIIGVRVPAIAPFARDQTNNPIL